MLNIEFPSDSGLKQTNYILDLSSNQFLSDQVHNQKIVKSVPINDNQFYFVSSQSNAGVSNTDIENNPNFITGVRNSSTGELSQTTDTFFGSGKRNQPFKTNGLQEDNNLFSVLIFGRFCSVHCNIP